MKYARSSRENTCMAMIDASGATPLLPAAIPATCVPCVQPEQGAADPGAVEDSTLPGH